jgi:hypothetical protein
MSEKLLEISGLSVCYEGEQITSVFPSKKEKPSASPGSRAVEKVPCCERSCG